MLMVVEMEWDRYGWLRRVPVLVWAWIAALLLRGVLFDYTYGPDGRRFVAQARSLLAGEGFHLEGQPSTWLPPGYPVALSAVLRWYDDPKAAVVGNFVLTLAAIGLIYAALARRDRRLAALAALALAMHPLLAQRTSEVRSEVFGVFLMAAFVCVVARLEEGAGSWGLAGIAGMLAMALVLSSPATMPLAAAVWLVLAWHARGRTKRLAALAAGSLALMIPWQVSCYRSVGHIEPLVYSSSPILKEGFSRWMRSWMLRPGEMDSWWWPEAFDEIPDRAFSSRQQRDRLRQAYRRYWADPRERNEYDAVFTEAGNRRFREHPLRTWLGYPLLRAVLLWIDMPQIGDAQPGCLARGVSSGTTGEHPVGLRRALLRLAKIPYTLAVYGLYLAYPMGLVALGWMTWRDRRLVPAAILAGILFYTAAASWLAIGEVRRNLPFLPAGLLLLGYIPQSGRAASQCELPLDWLRPIVVKIFTIFGVSSPEAVPMSGLHLERRRKELS